MKRLLLLAVVIALVTPPVAAGPPVPPAPDALYAQAAQQILARDFSAPGLSYLLLDAHSGQLLAARWPAAEQPVFVGSLIKPFTALAYGESHGYAFPRYVCTGRACWQPRGHGRIGIEQAVAQSCNSYFRQLAAGLGAEEVAAVLERFGLRGLDEHAPAAALIGEGSYWRASPLALARAYAELGQRRSEEGVSQVLAGMALSAEKGTGSGVGRALPGRSALTKTGTAPCVHRRHASGDGYVMALYPAESPRVALLVRVHGVPGARAAEVAGRMLRALEESKP